jgi:DNA-binding MarR family transcriptional regulator
VAKQEAPIRVDRGLGREFAGADHRATAVVINLVRAESLVEAELARSFRRVGLTPATFNVLMILRGAGEPLCPYQIGERLLVTRGTVTGLLDSLEKRGLVRRVPHPDDRRMLLIEITPKATSLLDRMLPGHFSGEKQMMSCLSAREKDLLVELLGKIQAHLGAESDRAPEPVATRR